jgi:DNA-binding LacI/PurR family transcriptional regulator
MGLDGVEISKILRVSLSTVYKKLPLIAKRAIEPALPLSADASLEPFSHEMRVDTVNINNNKRI